MKPGDQFLMLFEAKRLAEPNETINDTNAGPNFFQNFWVAEAVGKEGCKILVCSDGWPDGVPPIPPGLTGGNFVT